jgi:lipopolysaccharide/colanic/teichoic acid biosynthesis glycosyltransferase
MAKRGFDVVVATLLLIVAVPFIVGAAIRLGLELRTWPFFVQDRIGRGGQPMRFLKLRTLPRDTPAYALKHDLDMSLSRFRAFLRARHLDELPQLVHVIAGQLSLVGPRPRMPDAYEPVDPDYARRRVEVPQGCTGLWQVGAHVDLLPNEAPQYDLFYVDRATLRLDVWILVRTALQAIGLAGPVMLHDVPGWALRRPATPVVHGLPKPAPVASVIDITTAALARETRTLVAAEDGAA